MMEIVDRIVRMASAGLPPDRIATEQEVTFLVTQLAALTNAKPEELTQALRIMHSIRLVRMDTGFALAERHTPWLDARRASLDFHYWTRLQLQLRAGLSPNVVTALHRTTDELLDLLGNPADPATWTRRGLVMGDVQSGKTATYSALICKAADAGYRFVVLLTGTLETLRRQTQRRLDFSFVGFDSSEQLKKNGKNLHVGVGLLNGTRQASVFTSTAKDFSVSTVQALGLSLSALKEPALVVVKKHTRILANLIHWLRSYNAPPGGGAIDVPFLLIDDEADYASINTNDADCYPTAVNSRVRELLALFRQTAYVGFTATPFANIFVDPDSDDEMLGDDLFPRHFIYALQAPTNYVGPRHYFQQDSSGSSPLRDITDLEDFLPAAHKASFTMTALPPSLVDALGSFVLANAVRDLRGHAKTHRSMLVNISQYTAVQDCAEGLVHSELQRMKDDVRHFALLPHDTAMTSPVLRHLHDVWVREYSSCEFSWEAVAAVLHEAIQPITTRAVNQRTGPGALDYDAHAQAGLRVVAVGGNSLSRGLTLEGLMTSYFCRRTQLYDTLLQMGRWFGYRPEYDELCRVWMTSESRDWFEHITDATEELRDELREMKRLGRTPQDFGLAVRSHPDALLVTARNKMRTAVEVTRIVSLDHQAFESVELPAQLEASALNRTRVEHFLRGLIARSGWNASTSSPKLIAGARRAEIAELLKAFQVPATEFCFNPVSIAQLLESTDEPVLDEWDVAIPEGEGIPVSFAGLRVAPQKRSVRFHETSNTLVVSGNRRRVGSRGVDALGLSADERADAEALALEAARTAARESNTPEPTRVNVADKYYRLQRKRPLLVLHLLQGHRDDLGPPLPDHCGAGPLVAIGLSFPKLGDSVSARTVKYRINVVKARELLQADLETDDEAPVIVDL